MWATENAPPLNRGGGRSKSSREITAEVIEHPDDLVPLADDWNVLAEPFASPLLTHEWFEACARASSPPARLCVVVIRKQNRVRAIAPLVLASRHCLPTLQFLGNPFCELCEPSGFLYADEMSLRDLLDAVFALGRPIRLDRIPAGSAAATMLAERSRFPLSIGPRMTRSLFVPTRGSWSDFEAGLPKSRRTNLKRKTKAAAKFGEVVFETVKPTPETYLGYLQTFISLEASGWKRENGTAITQNPYQHQFWMIYGESAARKGLLTVFTMRINGKPIAMRLAAEHAGSLWEFKIGYDETYRKCSPGVLLTHETIRYAFEHGLEAHEFLGSEENWEHIWTDSFRQFASYRFYPPSLTGLTSLVTDTAGCALFHARQTVARIAARKSGGC